MNTKTEKKALDIILGHAEEGAKLRLDFFRQEAENIDTASKHIAVQIAKGHKILLAGNGGSAADAQHIAGEFVNRFLIDRPPLPAIALTVDTSVLTAIANDCGADLIYAKQIQALGRAGDIFIAISTSGNSTNILQALKAAKEQGLYIIGLSGNSGGELAKESDICFTVPHNSTPLIQEIHITLGHLFCQLTDHYLFENVVAIQESLLQ